MIRRDYILRMIEECIRALSRLDALKAENRWDIAEGTINEQFKALLGCEAELALHLNETDLLQRLLGSESQVFRDKGLLVAALFHRSGETSDSMGDREAAKASFLQGLHLLLRVTAMDDIYEMPAYIPAVDQFLLALADDELPAPTHAMLMQYFERTGQFARAEDSYHATLTPNSDNQMIRRFGIEFYERLLKHSDDVLAAGNLPRSEIEEALRDLRDGLKKPITLGI